MPQGWQGALPFRYHLAVERPAPRSKVHLVSQQDYQRRIIWDVIGKIKGSQYPDDWVVVGNHRDAWVYGAVDPNSGTAAMLEAVHGIGALLKQGWHPKRTIVFCSWDAEEEGLIGSTEWVEQHAKTLDHAVAYFNVDVAVSGPDFTASAVPSLKEFVRELTRSVPSPLGRNGLPAVEDRTPSAGRSHRSRQSPRAGRRSPRRRPRLRLRLHARSCSTSACPPPTSVPKAPTASTTPPSTTTPGSSRTPTRTLSICRRWLACSALRRCAWRTPTCCPTTTSPTPIQISSYIEAAKQRATESGLSSLDFAPALAAAARFDTAARQAYDRQIAPTGDLAKMNLALRQTETAFITEAGLPNRPWYRHTIFAPGQYTGYAAVVIPGVNEAIDAKDQARAAQQLVVLTHVLDRAAETLESVH